ncbi:MAG TPA: ABC transporter permease [Methylomirabilota bacterium]|jgi:peptide/nickel transport system permease protein|nr:ABC transporter permease [Methylomirabilota bacterium]
MSDADTARDVVALPRVAAARPARRARLTRALGRTPVALIGGTTVAVVILVALAAPVLAPHDPVAQIAKPLLPPGGTYLAGTDEFGRDELSRLIHGARVSLYVGVLAVLIALAVGGTSGIVAGFHGGFVDDAAMRVMDMLLSMPPLVLAIAITAVLGPSLTNVMLAIGIVYSPTFARVARGPTLAVVRLPYIEAARAIGASSLAIVLRHVLPNVAAPILVQATVSLSTAILTEAALSFLGLGTQPPTASWGLMLSASRQYMLIDPWIAVLPGSAIAVTVLGFNLLGDGLRDVLDPQMPAQ